MAEICEYQIRLRTPQRRTSRGIASKTLDLLKDITRMSRGRWPPTPVGFSENHKRQSNFLRSKYCNNVTITRSAPPKFKLGRSIELFLACNCAHFCRQSIINKAKPTGNVANQINLARHFDSRENCTTGYHADGKKTLRPVPQF